MAVYSTTNPPFQIVTAVGGGFGAGSSDAGGNVWIYRSTSVTSAVRATGYFSNAKKLNMRVGDVMFVHDTATPDMSVNWVSSLSTAGAASISIATT